MRKQANCSFLLIKFRSCWLNCAAVCTGFSLVTQRPFWIKLSLLYISHKMASYYYCRLDCRNILFDFFKYNFPAFVCMFFLKLCAFIWSLIDLFKSPITKLQYQKSCMCRRCLENRQYHNQNIFNWSVIIKKDSHIKKYDWIIIGPNVVQYSLNPRLRFNIYL